MDFKDVVRLYENLHSAHQRLRIAGIAYARLPLSMPRRERLETPEAKRRMLALEAMRLAESRLTTAIADEVRTQAKLQELPQ